MKTGLIVFGVILLVIGTLFYFVPMQKITANTTNTENNGNTDTNSSSASVTIPVEWAYAFAIIGFVLLIFGLTIPSSNRKDNGREYSKRDSYEKVVESKENVKVGDGDNHKIVRERTEKYKSNN
jgi:uncharacterized membrane protein